MSLHAEANEIKKVLNRYGIEKLYHFTCIDNLPVIAKCGGIWSKQSLEQGGLLDKIITGGNPLSLNLDQQIGNWSKVHLYFCPNTPMAYRVQQNPEGRVPQSAHICYLIIDPVVALWDGVLFTDTNATQKINGHQRKEGMEGLKLIDFDTIKAHLNKKWVEPKERWHRNIQAECLAPDGIPLEYVKAISFISKASFKEGIRLWGEKDHPPFNVNKRLFHTGFPLVDDFLLTPEEVTKDNVHSKSFNDANEFDQRNNSKITLLVNLYATAGTPAKVLWLDNNGNKISEDNTEFEKGNNYWHWPSMEIAGLDKGNYSAEYYLAGIRWFKANFKIRG